MASNPIGFTVDAMLCDSAVTADGKLYIQGGGWNNLTPSTFPFQQSRIGLAIVVGVPYTATNQNHTLLIHIEGEDGARVPIVPPDQEDGEPKTTIGAQFNLGRPAQLQPGDAQSVPFAINFEQMPFESPGSYSIVIEINDSEIERLTFRILTPVGMSFPRP